MTAVEQLGDEPIEPATQVRYSVTRAIGEIVAELSGSRQLLRQLVLRDLRIRYKQAIFGFAWAVLMPVVIVASGILVRFAMSQVASGSSVGAFNRATVAALAMKGLAWGFFAGAIGFAIPSLTSNSNLVGKVFFPREVLPLGSILAQGVDSSIGALVLVLLAPVLGVTFSANLLWLPVMAALLFCFTVAAGLVLSCANVFFRDVKYIVQMMLTFGIFFTPVFFEPAMLGPRGAKLMMLNPLAPILEGARLAALQGHNLLTPLTAQVAGGTAVVWEPWYLAYSAAWALGGLLVSALVFHSAESTFPEYV